MENIGDPNKFLERFARRVVRKAYEKAGRPRSEFRNAWKHRNDSVFPYDDDIYQGAGQVNPYITSDYDEYVSRKQAYADSLKNYNAAVEFDRIKRLPTDSNEKYEAIKQYANKYFDKIGDSDVDKYPSDMIRGVFDGAKDRDVLGLYIPRKGIKSDGDEYITDSSGLFKLSKAGDRSMKPFQKVIYQKKPKTYYYDISREVSYPNTDDAQIWRILIGRNEYNLNPNAADFEQYKDPRYRGINSVVTDADRDAWNKRFSIAPFTREMTDEEAAELEKQGYTVKKRQQEAKQKGGEMDVSDVILGVQGDRPYEYAYYEDNDDYDYEAAERDGEVADEDGHMSDRYKKSTHPYYSTESTEHAGQYLGGKWVYPEDSSSWRYDNGNPVFVPSEFNKEVIWDRYHMSPEAFYAMYSDVTRDKVLLPEFQMAGENNIPTYHSPEPAIVTRKLKFGSPGWWGNKVAPWMDKAALATGFVPVIGDAASLLFDVGANFARYQYDKNDPTLPEWQRKDIAKANLKSGLGLAGIGALLGLAGTSMPSGTIRKGLKKADVVKWSDSQWDDAYNKAIKSGNIDEAQELRDLHFMTKAPESKTGITKSYRGSDYQSNTLREKYINEDVGEMNGVYSTFNNKYAKKYGTPSSYYLNITNPLFTTGKWTGIINDATKKNLLTKGYDGIINTDFDKHSRLLNFLSGGKRTENVIFDSNKMKLSDAITYDNAGNIIPLSKRDNFNVKDIRYGIVPPALLIGTGAAAYNRFNKDKQQYALGGPIRQLQGGKESKVPLNMPYVFSEKAPEGYYPTVENEEGMYSPLVVEPTVTVQASPAPYSKGWYALRPNKYNPYLPLEQQSKEAQADYIAQNTREATAKAAPYVAGTLGAAAATPYLISGALALPELFANPVVRTAAGKMLESTLAGEGVNAASKLLTDKTVGENVQNVVKWTTGYNGPENAIGRFAYDLASEMFNPGYRYGEELVSTIMPSGAVTKVLKNGNVAKWTNSMWDDAYNKAIKSGNIDEAQRLRDLHFKVSAPDTKIITESGMPLKTYHTSHNRFNSFKQSLDNEYDGFGVGNYFSKNIVNRGPIKYETYLNSTNPYIAKYKQDLPTIDGKSVRYDNINNDYLVRNHSGVFGVDGNEITIYNPKNIKSADAVTYDNFGNIIPLSKRDNFNINDIRYAFGPQSSLRIKPENFSHFDNIPVNLSDLPDYAQSPSRYNLTMSLETLGKRFNHKDWLERMEGRSLTNEDVKNLKNKYSIQKNPKIIRDVQWERSHVDPKGNVHIGPWNTEEPSIANTIFAHELDHAYGIPKLSDKEIDDIFGEVFYSSYLRDHHAHEMFTRLGQIANWYGITDIRKQPLTGDMIKYAANQGRYFKDAQFDNNMFDFFNTLLINNSWDSAAKAYNKYGKAILFPTLSIGAYDKISTSDKKNSN